MDKIVEALLKFLPFAELLEKLGISPEISVLLSGAFSSIIVVSLTALVKYLFTRRKTSKIAQDLVPYFDYLTVKAARKLFIPTQFQNQSPTREDEPEFSYKFVSKSPLIPFFMKIAFNEKKESDKFYLVLADSGMGKSTFMLNLYTKFTSFFNIRRKYNIRLFPFGDARILDKIKEIKPEEARDTILLLDAFDEDKKLISPQTPDKTTDEDRFRSRLDEIIETVRDFREVVITSRTQYFPGQEDKPYELKIPRFGDDGFHTLAKLYLSPFDNKEIKHYLRKKYGIVRFWNRKKKKIAGTIVQNSPRLMVRPMLLAYIDYLVGQNKIFKKTYDIYETLVNKWIEREAKKRKHKAGDREKFKQDLCDYSRLVALEIFKQRKQTNLLSLPKNIALKIAHNNNINLKDYEITGQSLLTRDAEGSWKFAHKSIFEFLIAREVVGDPRSWWQQNFDGMDMTEQFILEKCPYFYYLKDFVFIKGGTFVMGSPENEADRSSRETQHEVQVNDFYMSKFTVTNEQFDVFKRSKNQIISMEKDFISTILNDRGKKGKQFPVVNVSWNDATAFCRWLSSIVNATFRLPTEAEWEYICRAGTTTPFNTGENLTTDQANYDGNYPYNNNPKGKSIGKTAPVGSYPPNAWGLYDMHGNVWEWCSDWFGEKYYDECKKQGVVENPKGPETGSARVLRGGSWNCFAKDCLSACRGSNGPDGRDPDFGFRVVFVP
ncbi:MAG: formylglycine-generating enzyme family protein [Spirochaetales bacterium]|nr:formylglycine-generating enzyme family protein [Spirochaetales bacterium]